VSEILWILSKLDLRSVIDIVLVSGVIYGVLLLVRGTQAVQLLRGAMLVALAVALIGSVAGFTAFNWLLRNGGQVLAVVVAVVLQPELRRALDRLGRAGAMAWGQGGQVTLERAISEIAAGCVRLAERRHGALIVIERETGLQEHVETGVEIDADVSSELLQTIFFPSTALHDGAVIIRGGRIVSAACVLPLAETIVSDAHLGTRHRAAVGITEQTDALSIVVSEETGVISMARGGRMVRHLDERRLVTLMRSLLTTKRARKPRRGKADSPEKRGADGHPEARLE
jgi:diadenylate cyclase